MTKEQIRNYIIRIFNQEMESDLLEEKLASMKKMGFEGKEGILIMSGINFLKIMEAKIKEIGIEEFEKLSLNILDETFNLLKELGYKVSEEALNKLAFALLDDNLKKDFASIKEKESLISIEETENRFNQYVELFINEVFVEEIKNKEIDHNTIIIYAGTARLIEIIEDEYNESVLADNLIKEYKNLNYLIKRDYSLSFDNSKEIVVRILNNKINHINFYIRDNQIRFKFKNNDEKIEEFLKGLKFTDRF